jgi:hypothetical protein
MFGEMNVVPIITFCGPDGRALPYLHPIDAIAVNGVHAVVVAPVLVRIELFRSGCGRKNARVPQPGGCLVCR